MTHVIKILEYFFVETLRGPLRREGEERLGSQLLCKVQLTPASSGPWMWQRAKCEPCVALKDPVWGRSGAPETP